MNEAAPRFRMIDVGRKRVTRRRAIATGTIKVGAKVFDLIRDKALPKGDVIALAEVAGITGAKKTPDLLLMCHPLELEQVSIHTAMEAPDTVRVYCQVTAHAKTGVEMEAIMAVQAALATIWDLSKGTEPNLTIGEVKLLTKEGGKSGLWTNPDGIPSWLESQLPETQTLDGVKAAVIVASDRAAKGEYEDTSGRTLQAFLTVSGAKVGSPVIVEDDHMAIETAIRDSDAQLVIISGGTGAGPRDVTPDVVAAICDHMLDGIGEMLRAESAYYTDMAWLSRMGAGVCGDKLVIALPGSTKAVEQCWRILLPILPHALSIANGGKHD